MSGYGGDNVEDFASHGGRRGAQDRERERRMHRLVRKLRLLGADYGPDGNLQRILSADVGAQEAGGLGFSAVYFHLYMHIGKTLGNDRVQGRQIGTRTHT